MLGLIRFCRHNQIMNTTCLLQDNPPLLHGVNGQTAPRPHLLAQHVEQLQGLAQDQGSVHQFQAHATGLPALKTVWKGQDNAAQNPVVSSSHIPTASVLLWIPPV